MQTSNKTKLITNILGSCNNEKLDKWKVHSKVISQEK